jgi:hypothetical protein
LSPQVCYGRRLSPPPVKQISGCHRHQTNKKEARSSPPPD